MSDIETINNEEYVNRKELFRILWELGAETEIFESLFDGNDMVDYGFKIGLTKQDMLDSDIYDNDFLEDIEDE